MFAESKEKPQIVKQHVMKKGPTPINIKKFNTVHQNFLQWKMSFWQHKQDDLMMIFLVVSPPQGSFTPLQKYIFAKLYSYIAVLNVLDWGTNMKVSVCLL